MERDGGIVAFATGELIKDAVASLPYDVVAARSTVGNKISAAGILVRPGRYM